MCIRDRMIAHQKHIHGNISKLLFSLFFSACFEMFDMNNDAILNDSEIENMVSGLIQVYQQYDGVSL